MKIHQYYRNSANLSLNGGILSFVPIIIIIWVNLSYFRIKEIMLLTIPFIIFSLLSFQVYLLRIKQAQKIEKNMILSKGSSQSLLNAKQLLAVFLDTADPSLSLYYPDGYLAGSIRKHAAKRKKPFTFIRTFALHNSEEKLLGIYKVKGVNQVMIEVCDSNGHYLGCYQKKRKSLLAYQKDFHDASGKLVGGVEGAVFFMDEQITDPSSRTIGRLQRGRMPVEWSPIFPEANTPVFTFNENLSEHDRLLRMAVLINEYFIER